MAGDWEIASIGEVADFLTGFPFKSEFYSDSRDAVRLLRGDNIVQGSLRWDDAKQWPADDVASYELFQLQDGDVVLAMDRPWIAAGLKYAWISKQDLPCLLVQRTTRLRGTARLDSRFLRYVVGSREFSQHIQSVSTGSIVPHVSSNQIKAFVFSLPPLEEQKAIADVLVALDDKIALNHRINAELEAMAKLLYDYWFVQFDFPISAAQDAALGKPGLEGQPYRSSGGPMKYSPGLKREIPAGWRVGNLGEIATNPRHGIDPKDLAEETPYVGLEHIERQDFSLWRWGTSSDVDSQKSKFTLGDFLFGKLRPYFHKVCQTPFDGICSTDILVIRAKHECYRSLVGCQIFETDFVEHTTKHSSGTQMPRANWAAMSDYQIAVPPTEILEAFNALVCPLRTRSNVSVLENQELGTLRDWLLPMLMNGQVTVG